MEQLSDIRFPVIIPPAADDRVYHLDHVLQRHRRSSLRQVADLILEPGHRLFARHGVEVGLAWLVRLEADSRKPFPRLTL